MPEVKKERGEEKKKGFYAGVVSACDVVALYGQGVILKEIVCSCGYEETIKEIMKNGLPCTKELAKSEFGLCKK